MKHLHIFCTQILEVYSIGKFFEPLVHIMITSVPWDPCTNIPISSEALSSSRIGLLADSMWFKPVVPEKAPLEFSFYLLPDSMPLIPTWDSLSTRDFYLLILVCSCSWFIMCLFPPSEYLLACTIQSSEYTFSGHFQMHTSFTWGLYVQSNKNVC